MKNWLQGRQAQHEEATRRTRQTWFGRVSRLFGRPQLDEALWDDLEEALIGADVGYDLAQDLLDALRRRAREDSLSDGQALRSALQEELVRILQHGPTPHLWAGSEGPAEPGAGGRGQSPSGGVVRSEADSPATPQVLLIVGVNGSGKTTSIAKLARLLQQEGQSVLLAAADTFRAAAIAQLQHWGARLDVEVVAHRPGADPGAVVFDALQAAQRRHRGVVLIDTAGRLHTKVNLMEEMKKLHRVIGRALPQAIPHVLLVLDATTGQNGLAQAREFTRAVPVDSALLAKLDGTAKGGVIFAIRRDLGIPVAFIGTGEGLDDLAPFDPVAFVQALLAEP